MEIPLDFFLKVCYNILHRKR